MLRNMEWFCRGQETEAVDVSLWSNGTDLSGVANDQQRLREQQVKRATLSGRSAVIRVKRERSQGAKSARPNG
jgi:hypothetical protein